jgi:hypothetical protein
MYKASAESDYYRKSPAKKRHSPIHRCGKSVWVEVGHVAGTWNVHIVTTTKSGAIVAGVIHLELDRARIKEQLMSTKVQ